MQIKKEINTLIRTSKSKANFTNKEFKEKSNVINLLKICLEQVDDDSKTELGYYFSEADILRCKFERFIDFFVTYGDKFI